MILACPLRMQRAGWHRQFLALCGFLFFLFHGHAWAANPVVLVVGDSLSAAYGLAEKDGWVNLLRQKLAKQTPRYDVVNASISGDTTSGGLARINAALEQHRPAVVIIELGGNDGLRGLPLEGTRRNLEGMVRAVKQAKARVLIVGVELPPNYGPAYTQQFAKTFADVASQQHVAMLPSLLVGFADKRELFQADGVHPIAPAQAMMLETVWKALGPLLKQR